MEIDIYNHGGSSVQLLPKMVIGNKYGDNNGRLTHQRRGYAHPECSNWSRFTPNTTEVDSNYKWIISTVCIYELSLSMEGCCCMLHAVSISPQFLSSVTILLWLLFFAANNCPVFVPVTGRLLVPCDLKEKCVGSSKDL